MSSAEEPSGPSRDAGYHPLLHAMGLAVALAALWLLLSGYFLPLLLGLGIASVALCVLIAMRMDVIDHEGLPIHLTWSALAYMPWLLWEILKANIDVAGRVISPRMSISPTMFNTPVTQKSDLGHVIYANSITLTPGTVSVDLEPGKIVVHALSRDGADGVLEGEMDRRVTQLEGLSE
jgi:multicomponent Na+:H+ antiporter subunit E